MTAGDLARLERIEQQYSRTPYVREVCVMTGPRPAAGATVCFDPVLAPGDVHALVVADAAFLAAHRVVGISEWVRFEFETLAVALPPADRIATCLVRLEPLPRTASGAIDRDAVARALATPAPEAPGPPDGRDPVLARVVEAATRASGRPAWPDAHLDLDLALDSIARVELSLAVQRDLGVEAEEAACGAAATVGALADAMRRAVPAPVQAPADPWQSVLSRTTTDEAAGAARRGFGASVVTFGVLALIRWTARAGAGLDVRGLAHLPRRGPFLLCPNHLTLVDGFLIAAVLPFRTWRELFFLGASEYYGTRASAWFARKIGIVAVDADANLPGAIRSAAAGLRRGGVLMIFPEGERSIDGELKRFRPGGPILASRLGLPIVPVAITGAFAWWPRGHGFDWSRLRRRDAPLSVRFGPPVVPGGGGVPLDERALAAALAARVAALAGPGA